MDRQSPSYRLVRRPLRAAAPPGLDDAQRRVVSHTGGPLLVLAGPGTGKTTAIVEAVVHRVTRRGIDPSRVLVLTFSRKAAEELRERITMRLGRTTREPLALTFHSYAYALARREFVLAGDEPPRCCSSTYVHVTLGSILSSAHRPGAPARRGKASAPDSTRIPMFGLFQRCTKPRRANFLISYATSPRPSARS